MFCSSRLAPVHAFRFYCALGSASAPCSSPTVTGIFFLARSSFPHPPKKEYTVVVVPGIVFHARLSFLAVLLATNKIV